MTDCVTVGVAVGVSEVEIVREGDIVGVREGETEAERMGVYVGV